MTMIDFTPLAQAIITLLAAVITVYLIPWIKTRLSAEQLAYAKTAVGIAVYAAEKAYGAGNGDKKLKYVEDVLAARGIALDTVALKSMVDAEIKRMEQMEPPKLIEAIPAEDVDVAEAQEEDEDEEEPQPPEV